MYLGIDIGTSSVKAVLIDADQKIIASESAPLTVERPHPGWSEQYPQSWIDGTSAAIDALAKRHAAELKAVRGIGLSGQMHGATLLDHADRPLRPCILWNDGRSFAEAAALDADTRFREITGNIVFPGFTASKLVWVHRHEPKIFGDVARVLLPKDYVRLWLSGDSASDMSDSAGTSWLDVAKRDWSDDLLAATHLRRDQMPSLHEGTEPTGKLRAVLASRWGMDPPPAIAGGAGDNAASACGVGTVAPGAAFVSLGTSGVLFVSNEKFRPNAASAVHAFCHALPNTWHQMGVILSAAASLEWLVGILKTDAAGLSDLVEAGEAGEGEPLFFLPYLSGERTPHNDAAARGSFVGLSHNTDRAALARAVMEGVAFAFADCLAALNAAGTSVERATAVGGGSRSRAWLKIIGNVLNVPIDVPAEGDFGGAFGAARLGLIAAEKADPIEVCRPPEIRDVIAPDPAAAEKYRAAFTRYRALYPAIKGVFAS
ncbi:MAG: xylulokinase [Propylenella sp.]